MARTVSMWGQHGPRPTPLTANDRHFTNVSTTAAIEIACPPERAWDLVTDIARIGEFSPECVGARWLDGSGPAVGARFEGTNRIGGGDDVYEWIRLCNVTAADAPRHFAYVVGDRFDASPASLWDFSIEPAAAGCRIVQTFRHDPGGITGMRTQADAEPDRVTEIIEARLTAMHAGMEQTLAAIKAVLEGP